MVVILMSTRMFGVDFDIRVIGTFSSTELAENYLKQKGYSPLLTGEWNLEVEQYQGEEDYMASIEEVQPP